MRVRGIVRIALVWAFLTNAVTAQAVCVGDCNDSGDVRVDELVTSVNIALDRAPLSQCLAIETNTDGQATINELITAVNNALRGCRAAPTPTPDLGNQPPQVDAGDDVITTIDQPPTLTGSATDDGMPSPPAAVTLSWSKVSGSGTVVFGSANAATTTATFSEVGSYVLRLTADDSARTGSDEVTVHVDLSMVNVGPMLDPVADQTITAGSALSLALVGRDGNPFDALSYSLVTGPEGARVAAEGIFGFAPLAAQLGTHAVTVRVQDPDGLMAETSFDVMVVAGNQPPVFGPLSDDVTPLAVPYTKTLAATDPDAGDTLTFTLLSGTPGMTLTGAQLAWTPAADQFGTHVVSVAVSDGRGGDTRSELRIMVPNPAAPKARGDAYEVILGNTLTVPASGVLANDESVDGSPITAEQLTQPDKGMVTAFGADGSFTYTAPPALPPPPPLDAELKYAVDIGNGVHYGPYPPLVADLDGDAKSEIIFWSGDQLYAVHGGSGELLFSANSLPEPHTGCAMYGRGFDSFAVADVDDDGVTEIVMSAQCAADNYDYIYVGGRATRVLALAYDAEAPAKFTVKWLSEPLAPRIPLTPGDGHLYVPFGGQPAFASFTIARLRPEEKPTVLFGKTYGGFGGEFSNCGKVLPGKIDPYCRFVFAVDGETGAVKTPYYATPEQPGIVDAYADGASGAPAAPLVADADNDGALDILYQGTLWELDGTVKRQFDGTAATGTGTTDSLLLDLDGDPEMEIVTVDNANYRRPGFVKAWKPDGRLLWSVTIPGTTVVTRLSAGDIDRSGRPSILVGIYNMLWAMDSTGSVKWVRILPLTAGFSPFINGAGMELPIYDLNGDGVVEIIVQVSKQTIVFLRGDTGETQTSWSYPNQPESGTQGVQAPVIADLDGTGEASLIWYHDVNLNGTSYLQVLKGATAPWRAVSTHFNQRAFWGSNFNADGSIPTTYPRHTESAATNLVRQQPPVPYTVEPRLRTEATFTYAAQDGPLASDAATVTIGILPENRPPVFTALPAATYPSGFYWAMPPLTVQLAATDPDVGDVVTFALTYRTCGDPNQNLVSISPSGLFSYGDTASNNTQCLFQVRVTDDHGAFTEKIVSIFFTNETRTVPDLVGLDRGEALGTLGSIDLAGTISEIPSPATAGQVLSQSPLAGTEVPRGSPVQLLVSLGPGPLDTDDDGDGFTENQGDCNDGNAAFNPGLAEVPDNGIDENCDGSERIVREVVIEPASALRVTGEQVAFSATAVYLDGTSADVTGTTNWASSTPAVATINASGVARALDIGTTNLRATFGGSVGYARFDVGDRAAGDQDEPTAIISTPAEGGSVTGLTQITGTATDTNFLRYELAVAAAGETSFSTIGEGKTAVVDGVLGSFDPTVLVNGQYRLRLTVVDANENEAMAEVSVQVEGLQKVGNFTLSFTDVAIPVAGLPVRVIRTYDSRDKRRGDFGVGWSLDVKLLRLSVSRVLGTGWQILKPGLSFALVPTADHVVSIELPDGKTEMFDVSVTPQVSPFVPLSTVRASFVARPGTLGTLDPLDNDNLLILDAQPGEVSLVDDETLNEFHPERFRYTEIDGTQYVVTRSTGVESIRDPNGNTVTVSMAGIVHSSGTGVTFTRDSEGRITAVADPKGQMQTYAYSAAGDLVAHTDAEGNTTRYFYDRFHGLIRIEDPLGRAVARSDYDDAGRLIAVTDANGATTTFEHDVEARRELTRDPLGRPTVIDYDERGNVLALTNALGQTQRFTYDERDNQLTHADELGATTSYTYDATGGLMSITDSLGRTTTFTRDGAGRLLTTTDPRGHTHRYQYDAKGNLIAETDPLGGIKSTSYDASGNVRTLTDATGAVTENQYDAAGRRMRLIDAAGGAVDFHYDANGNVVGQEGAGAAWTLSYDANNRITGTDVGEQARSVTYDVAGRMSEVTTRTGRALPVHVDPLGRLARVDSPDGRPLLMQTYDAAGNPTIVTDSAGNQFHTVYDAANRPVEVHAPNGSVQTVSYDAAGRIIATTDAVGRTTAYVYDAAGKLIRVTDALGGETRYAYDSTGNLIEQIDPNGQATRFIYDELSRLVGTTFADGSVEALAYDSAGRVTESTDAAGNATTYAYDDLGRLASVTNALGEVTRYQYEGSGPRTAVVDGNGHTTRTTYDGFGRPVETQYALGNRSTVTYGPDGRVLTRTNGEGETVTYEYDARGRLAKAMQPGGESETYAYTATGRLASVTDARGVTAFAYDPKTLLLRRVTEPDGSYVRYEYDAAGKRTLMAHAGRGSEQVTRFAYDDLDRLVRVTDPVGAVTVHGYDAAGNLTSIQRPNGTMSEIAYDERNRPVSIIERGNGGSILARENYTLDALGNRTRIDYADGARVEYAYDVLGRVRSERHFDAAATLVFEQAFAYDAAGNLIRRGSPAMPVTFIYDANDQLVSGDGVTYAYDQAGRRVAETRTAMPGMPTVRYTWDARDRLVAFEAADGSVTAYEYDFDGLRQGKTAGGTPTSFLVDRKNLTGYPQIVREATSGDPERGWVYGRELLAATDGPARRQRHADALGSTRLLTDAAGAVTDSYAYTAYGELRSQNGDWTSRHLFAAEQFDPESERYYLRARYYDPNTGSFLSRDPEIADDRDPLALNPYLYAAGNPVNRVDPSGREPSIPSLLLASAQRLHLSGQQVLQVLKAKEKAEEAIGEAMRRTGGLLAVYAIVETLDTNDRVIRWFGGGLFRAADAANLLPDAAGKPVEIAAAIALSITAFNMLGVRDVEFDIQGIGIPPLARPIGAPAAGGSCNDAKNAGQFAAVVKYSPPPVKVELCRSFFGSPLLPEKSEGIAGRPSQAGIMVHEFAHIASNRLIKDNAYACDLKGITFKGQTFPGVLKLVSGNVIPGAALLNADSYRCWVRDSAIGYGNERLDQELY